VRSFIDRVATGGAKNNVKFLGEQIFEIKIDRGPGYRVYFGKIENDEVILLILGGDKSSQVKDIRLAKLYWRIYVSN